MERRASLLVQLLFNIQMEQSKPCLFNLCENPSMLNPLKLYLILSGSLTYFFIFYLLLDL